MRISTEERKSFHEQSFLLCKVETLFSFRIAGFFCAEDNASCGPCPIFKR